MNILLLEDDEEIALSFLMYKALANITIPFEINVPIYILTILAVMGVVALSMFMSSSKLKGDNIIDVLKNDIC